MKLNTTEKLQLEKFLGMSGGYVLDFYNRTLQEFVAESTGLDIYDAKYEHGSGSKANRLRAFWNQEPAHIVGKLIVDMLEYWKATKLMRGENISSDQALYEECLKIGEKLKQNKVFENIDALKPNVEDKNFHLLAKSIKESIERNEPEVAIDRLHTFAVRYIRELCDRHSIEYKRDVPLHGLFGGYIKFLREKEFIESKMTEYILKSSISVLEAFNDVRNNRSFAHDNPILNYHESSLIFNNISNIIRFIEVIEKKINDDKQKNDVNWEEIFSEEEIEAATESWIQMEIDRKRGK